MAKKALDKAKRQKNDEFYTRLEDIEAEISMHRDYVRHFQGKTVLCNCDDPEYSNFFTFFRLHFKQLGLKKLITTHYNKDGSPSYKIEWEGETLKDDTVNMITTPLKENGDFRSEECIELLKEADIVVTNPPFSLFREYVAQLMEYGKEFVVLGNPNAITYKEFFPLLKDNRVWLGYKSMGSDMLFNVSKEAEQELKRTKKEGSGYKIVNGNFFARTPAIWFTNLDIDKRHEPLPLTKNYKGHEENYPKYDNYDAINVDKIADIPKDYKGIMGVPITFFDEFCPEQFEILGLATGRKEFDEIAWPTKRYINPIQINKNGTVLNGSKANTGPAILLDKAPLNTIYYTADNADGPLNLKYARILIRRKEVSSDES